MNAVTLGKVKDRFKSFRSEHRGVKGKGLRYPEELQQMLVALKGQGHTFNELAEASGLSMGGINKIIERHRSGASAGVRRGPGRPRKEESQAAPKRGRGRPRKSETVAASLSATPKRGRGRPRKNPEAQASAPEGVRRGRGRPRKDASANVTQMPKRGRGRPPKAARAMNPTTMAASVKSSALKAEGRKISVTAENSKGQLRTLSMTASEFLNLVESLKA